MVIIPYQEGFVNSEVVICRRKGHFSAYNKRLVRDQLTPPLHLPIV
jgi:hypothetical protein